MFLPSFKYLWASLKLLLIVTQSQTSHSIFASHGLVRSMKSSIQKVLEQLDKVMFKKTDTTKTLTIMFTICVITVGAELWLLCLTKADQINLKIPVDHSIVIYNDWHDTIVALFSACKDLQVRGDIKGCIFELVNWKLEYGMDTLHCRISSTANGLNNSGVICRPGHKL